MGVQGLLPFVSSASREAHLSEFSGLTLAVDVSGWLHRGAISCATELAQGQKTDAFMRYSKRMLALLRRHGIEPLLVFDGASIPMKVRTDASRSAAREAARLNEDWPRSVHITAEMKRQFVQWLKLDGTSFLIAPFEADAQIAHLVMQGRCAAAISEDSDLLAYQCPTVLYKLSPETGYGRLIEWEGLRSAQDSKGRLLFDGKWDGEWEAWKGGLFTSMCILAGCDYLTSFPGCGITTAHKLLRSSRSVERAVERLQKKTKGLHPSMEQVESYLLQLHRCQEVFSHARVWDSLAGAIVHLRPLPQHLFTQGEQYDHLGPPMDLSLAQEVCLHASRNPATLESFASQSACSPDASPQPKRSCRSDYFPTALAGQPLNDDFSQKSRQTCKFVATAWQGSRTSDLQPPYVHDKFENDQQSRRHLMPGRHSESEDIDDIQQRDAVYPLSSSIEGREAAQAFFGHDGTTTRLSHPHRQSHPTRVTPSCASTTFEHEDNYVFRLASSSSTKVRASRHH